MAFQLYANKKKTIKIFRALSDETRLLIIQLLARGERCVCEIYSALKLSQPKVSRHLAYLRETGLVKNKKVGLWQYYSLNLAVFSELKLNKTLGIKKQTGAGKGRKGCDLKCKVKIRTINNGKYRR